MNYISVWLFTVRSKEDKKRYLFTLKGSPESAKEFRQAFYGGLIDAEDYDLRTIRWLDRYCEASSSTGVDVSYVYDSQDNAFFEDEG